MTRVNVYNINNFLEVTAMRNQKPLLILPLASLLLTGCFFKFPGINILPNSDSSSESKSSESSSSSSSESSIIEEKGYVKVDNMSMVCSDLNSTYAPALGDVKMLVVPIQFAGNTASGYSNRVRNWTEADLQNLDSIYFGEENSLKHYYDVASFGRMRMTGMVSDVYQNTTYKVSDILADESMDTLWDMMDEALAWVIDSNPDINWDEFDINHDGNIDNIHLITNYTSNKWADNLWPHMFYTRRQHTGDKLGINVYSMSGIGYVYDYITATHEQGHIFGLQDYYDYSDDGSSPIDYIGHLDMQSHNVFDWNSFSKLSVGWVEPYVVTGEEDVTTITISAASKNGDCIIVPADYSTWNGSAFDEYFLIELFSPYGNNEKDWDRYYNSIGNGGVRLYHVDARAYGSDILDDYNPELLVVDDLEEQEINCLEDINKYAYNTLGANNSSDWRDYEGGIEQLANHPLLSIVQRGGEFTFAQKNNAVNHTLSVLDLFKNGHTFTFENYSHFLNKDISSADTMDNGEVFPYEISFSNWSKEKITVTFTKVK